MNKLTVFLMSIEKDDLEIIKHWASDKRINKNMVMGRFPGGSPIYCGKDDVYTDYRRLRHSKNDVIFAINNYKRKIIGIVGLYDIDWISRNSEFRIVIGDVGYLGKGLGTSVTKKVVQYAFDDLGLHKVHLGCNAEDERANKCYQKVGFVKEGTIRDYNFRNGRYYDANIYSILEGELKC